MASKNYFDANKKKKLYEAESSMEHTSKIFDVIFVLTYLYFIKD
jgi:hypothetical protein